MNIVDYGPIWASGGAIVAATIIGLTTWRSQVETRRQSEALAADSRQHAERLAASAQLHTTQLAVEAKRSELRSDRREAIAAVLGAVQEVDRLVDAREQGRGWDEDQARLALHQLYFRQKVLRVFATHELAQATDAFVHRMFLAVYEPVPPDFPGDIYSYMMDEQQRFVAAASRELYVPQVYERHAFDSSI